MFVFYISWIVVFYIGFDCLVCCLFVWSSLFACVDAFVIYDLQRRSGDAGARWPQAIAGGTRAQARALNSFQTALTPNPDMLCNHCSGTHNNKTHVFECALQMLSSSGAVGWKVFMHKCVKLRHGIAWYGTAWQAMRHARVCAASRQACTESTVGATRCQILTRVRVPADACSCGYIR